MNQSLPSFALATGIPVLLLAMAALLGGGWVAAALVFALIITNGLDRFIVPALPDRPFADHLALKLSLLLALAHWVLLVLAVGALSWGTGGLLEKLGLFAAMGLFFGQVSNSNAHELIHRAQSLPRRLGASVYTSLFFGHHSSAHPAIHHRFLGTPLDPNTARKGEGFYRYAVRAWIGSFQAGLRVELARLGQKRLPGWHHSNPYWHYCLGTLATSAAMAWAFGPKGVLFHVAFGVFATTQLLLSDYVQHYGLQRRQTDEGRYEPVSTRHSWNAPHWFTSLMMLNAPRHSDHHKNPSKPYNDLENLPEDQAPVLPHSLPVMAVIALYPRLWRRVMKPHLAQWAS